MPKQVEEIKWLCVHCKKPYKTEQKAKDCERAHDFIYVKMTRIELKKLIEFIYTGRTGVLPGSLLQRLYDLDKLGVE